MKIKKITLENYRSIKWLEVDTDNKNVVLTGLNKVGKTSVIEAVFLLLSGKLFDGRAKQVDQNIKPVGSPEDTKTTITVEFDDGFTFGGVYWQEFKDGITSGSSSSFMVNGAIEKRVSTAYSALWEHLGIKQVSDLFTSDPLLKQLDFVRLFYDIWYIKDIDYKLLRALVIDIVGDISYENIINQNLDTYGRLLNEYQKSNKDLDALKERLRSERLGNKVNPNGLEQQSVTLKEIIKNYERESEVAIDEDAIKTAQNEVDRIDKEINKLKLNLERGTSDITKDITNDILKAEAELEKEEAKITKAHYQELERVRNSNDLALKGVNELNRTLENEKTMLSMYHNKVGLENTNGTILNTKLESAKKTHADLVELYKNENRQVTAPVSKETFNLYEAKEFSDRKEQLKGMLVAKKDIVKELEREIVLQQNLVDEAYKTYYTQENRVEFLRNELEVARNSVTRIAEPILNLDTEIIIKLNNDIKTYYDKIKKLQNDNQGFIDKIKLDIYNLQQEKQAQETILNKRVEREFSIKKAKETREQLVVVDSRIEEVKSLLQLIKLLESEKYTMLGKNVEEKFGTNIKFKLFDYNQDGSIDTKVCELLVKDGNGVFVNIKDINTGNYPITSLDFITSVKRHYNVQSSFVFIDEFGQLDDTNAQRVVEFGEQVLATKVGTSSKIKVELL